MRIAIIGAGISGLSLGQMLKGEHEVTVYETHEKAGGLMRCDIVDDSLFHTTGGHVFNTKNEAVRQWFWSHFDKDSEFVLAERNASIVLGGMNIGYPIENHVYQLSDEVLRSFVDDLTAMTQTDSHPSNFEQFLRERFGATLYELYFKPYNQKVWRRPLDTVPLSWLEGKLPMPTVNEMIYNNIRQIEERQFVHSTFYYPRQGGSQFIIGRLSEGLDINCCNGVEVLNYAGGQWRIGAEVYDAVVYTGNIKDLPGIVHDIDMTGYADAIAALDYHGTTAAFCEIDPNPYSWIYLPEQSYEAHRIICTGNFAPSNNRSPRLTATVEFTDYISETDIMANLSKMPYSPAYKTHHYERYTYPIQDAGTRNMIRSLKSRLAPLGLHLTGRFADWEYYNMDAAIAAAMVTAQTVQSAIDK